MAVFQKQIDAVVKRYENALNDISQELWNNPELLYKEYKAHQLLTDFLEKEKFTVTRKYKELDTAFRAEFQSAKYDPSLHATIAVLCEYDALPEIGHACGHNLIAESGIAAGLALQDILRNQSDAGSVEGRLVVLGCPAEEGGGGKVDLIRASAFDDIDFAMMVHPFPWNDLEPIILGIERCYVKYHGKAAHASCGPWEGINALDAAVAAYQDVSLFRQQMKPNWRVHAVILNGGAKPNIIPDLTVSHYYMRTQNAADMQVLKTRLMDIFNAAAKATGCTMEIEWEGRPYTGMLHNSTMSALYKKYAAAEGMEFPENVPGFYGSTDMGNVSITVPSIHPCVFIGQQYLIHTKDMAKQAGSPQAQPYILNAAKAMAFTAIELYQSKELRDKAKLEFEQKKKSFTG
ncbi:xaa-Arg dipeptidase-like isoform X2 [Paramacrobiotus metropolitanus]|nr:xaa-Arg dipeptidase-like isoform X2 [Paramacrobiotus metropolitanus]XP_055334575.1 xaa-Arg dipeptidase-like isoform X2 [Paramacrobiotus metropolitanus]